MIGAAVDSLLAHGSAILRRRSRGRWLAGRNGWPTRGVMTSMGRIRVLDTVSASAVGPDRQGVIRCDHVERDEPEHCVVLVPDGPNLIEHHERLIALLSSQVRVVCLEMPGFGHSLPGPSYRHSLDEGATVMLGVLDALGVGKVTLAVSCANGFYALRAARRSPERFASLVLAQTPSLAAMHNWTKRVVPRPLRIPVFGQVIAWLFRGRMAHAWYRSALPEGSDPEPWQRHARHALASGGCFCLAGVVQRLMAEKQESLAGVVTPVTIVWGTQDRSHRQTDPASGAQDLPQAEIVIFDRSGHFPDLEEPDRFSQLVLDRVARHA